MSCPNHEPAFAVMMQAVPGAGNGAVNVNPESPFGWWRRPVARHTPEGGGCPDTGWYRVERVYFPSRAEAALALGGSAWDVPPEEWAAEGEAALAALGY